MCVVEQEVAGEDLVAGLAKQRVRSHHAMLRHRKRRAVVAAVETRDLGQRRRHLAEIDVFRAESIEIGYPPVQHDDGNGRLHCATAG